MLVSDVMVKNVRTAKLTDSIRSVAGVICTNKISGIPVVDDDNTLVGVISEKDILSALLPNYQENPKSQNDFEGMEESYSEVLSKTVGDLMTKRVDAISPECKIMEAASKMSLKRFRRIPVIGPDSKLKGIVSLGDIHKAIFKRELGIAA
jgi:CBS domain-containing protein